MLNTRKLPLFIILMLGVYGAYSLFESHLIKRSPVQLPISRERMIFDPFKFKTHSLPQYARLIYPTFLRSSHNALSICVEGIWAEEIGSEKIWPEKVWPEKIWPEKSGTPKNGREDTYTCTLAPKFSHMQGALLDLLLKQPDLSATQRKWNRWLREGLHISSDQNSIIFSGIRHRQDFLDVLGSPYFVWPQDIDHQIKQWAMGTQISIHRPAQFIALDNDTQAYIYFALGFVHQTRRVPTSTLFVQSNGLKASNDSSTLVRHPIYRFEYLGFSQKMKSVPHLVRTVACGYNQVNFAKLTQSSDLYSYLPQYLQSSLRPDCSNSSNIHLPPLDLYFPASGGQDMSRVMSWFQEQLKVKGLSVQLHSEEPKLFLKRLRKREYDFYRKGLTLDLPSCRNLLENFSSQGGEAQALSASASQQLDALLRQPDLKWEDCRKAFEHLVASEELIPLGTYEIVGEIKGKSVGKMSDVHMDQNRVESIGKLIHGNKNHTRGPHTEDLPLIDQWGMYDQNAARTK